MTNLPAEFRPDAPWLPEDKEPATEIKPTIAGVIVKPLVPRKDDRGQLTELLTTREGLSEPIVHVYQVHAAAGSVRGWVFHRRQEDRLAYTEGKFCLALYDLREDSETYGNLDVLHIGSACPCLITIPRFVAHALKNTGDSLSSFVNLPTNVYDPADPDKSRLPFPDPRIPFEF